MINRRLLSLSAKKVTTCRARAVLDKTTKDLIIKFVNRSSSPKQKTLALQGSKFSKPVGTSTVFQSLVPSEVNSFIVPTTIFPDRG